MTEKNADGTEKKIEVPSTEKKPETTDAPAPVVTEESSQDPIKVELDRVNKGKKVYTESEKATFNLKKNAQRAKELGVDPLAVINELNIDTPEDMSDDTPVTVGMLKKKGVEDASKKALTLADDITDENERELVKHHLENTIKPSGDPQEDLRKARAIVNDVKNTQIATDALRKTAAKTHNSAAGAPAKTDQIVEFTAEELGFMRPPFNLSKEAVLAARPKR